MRAVTRYSVRGVQVSNCGRYGRAVTLPPPTKDDPPRQLLDYAVLMVLDGVAAEVAGDVVAAYVELYEVETQEREVVL